MTTTTADTVNRKMASKLLGVSVRTVDRYITSGKIPAYTQNGRVLLKKRDVMGLLHNKTEEKPTPVDTTRQSLTSHGHVYTTQADMQFYKELYQEAQHLLNDYQQKLEQSNYRIRNLESQMASALPAPAAPIQQPMHQPVQYSDPRREDAFAQELLKKEIEQLQQEKKLLQRKMKNEQLSRTIFAVLLYVLLGLQPVFWLLTR
ncbi:hypothetical protein CO046_04315 [Candidatus Peregrinibacteria bacterium CG_4_9_14_0_2_um_filter_53_11]|nr:MAG: hypothetical protein CO046_04315 [Candidatus Peregrinibacteria bacterium CG_4_9_14_0_2_um_filter_53_11]